MKNLITITLLLISSVAFSQQPLPSRNPKMLPSRAYQMRPQVIERKDGKVTIVISEQQFRMMQQRRFGKHEEPMCPKCKKKHKHH